MRKLKISFELVTENPEEAIEYIKKLYEVNTMAGCFQEQEEKLKAAMDMKPEEKITRTFIPAEGFEEIVLYIGGTELLNRIYKRYSLGNHFYWKETPEGREARRRGFI